MLKMDYSLLRGKIRTYFGSETNFVKYENPIVTNYNFAFFIYL